VIRPWGARITTCLVLMTACGGTELAHGGSYGSSDPAVLVVDDFARDVVGSWGQAAPGWAWSYLATAGRSLTLSVEGGRAVASGPKPGSKGILVTGPEIAADLEAAATFTVDRLDTDGTQNHWHVVVRVAGDRTYYSLFLLPVREGRALERILSAKDGTFSTLATGQAPFMVEPDSAYRLKVKVVTGPDGVRLFGRAWPASSKEPRAWHVTVVDRSEAPILGGRSGVRLSFYDAPAQMTVDDFLLKEA
jgi:hypothetical protein